MLKSDLLLALKKKYSSLNMNDIELLPEIQDRNRQFEDRLDIDIETKLGNMDFSTNLEENISTSVGTSPDSVLFMIGEMLLYDFNHVERSLEKLKMLEMLGNPSKCWKVLGMLGNAENAEYCEMLEMLNNAEQC